MNTLFIIGNGFDINLGMETRYTDFYKHYITIKSPKKIIEDLKQEISTVNDNWSDLELALGKYTDKVDSAESLDIIRDDIADNLAEYLQKEEDGFNFEAVDKSLFFQYLCNPEDSLLLADKEKLKEFRLNWHNTSPWSVEIMTFNYTRTIERIIGENTKDIEIGGVGRKTILLRGIEHIHGFLDERMILGVNDCSQISNDTFHENQNVLEAIVKENCNDAYKNNITSICRRKIAGANLICIFGSSIGETDNIWWKAIGEALTKRNDCRVIIFDRCEILGRNYGHKLPRIERAKRSEFITKILGDDQDQSKLTNRIYFGFNTNLFSIVSKSASHLSMVS